MRGLDVTESSLWVMVLLMEGLEVNRESLLQGFTGPVFATDRAIELVVGGTPFRDAYNEVKSNIEQLESVDPMEAVAKKQHLGASMGLDWSAYRDRLKVQTAWTRKQRAHIHRCMTKLLGVPYPELK
jgi:argininosuccinate lyase